MTPRRAGAIAALIVLSGVIVWVLFVGLPRWYGRPASIAVTSTPPANAAEPGRKIKARLFYVADDGTKLMSVEHDVAYAEQPVDQAREILQAQIAPVAAPLVSAVPPDTALRALFLTPRGEAVVDLSRDVAARHTGGSLNELLTIYTIVYALTLNMPAITAVQLLVEGRQADTLAGHVDLRRPLPKDPSWLVETTPGGQ